MKGAYEGRKKQGLNLSLNLKGVNHCPGPPHGGAGALRPQLTEEPPTPPCRLLPIPSPAPAAPQRPGARLGDRSRRRRTCSADPAPQEPAAPAGRQGAGAGTAGQTPGGQTAKQRNTAGKVLFWEAEGTQRGPQSLKESRVQHGPGPDVDSGGPANICRDLTGNTKAQPSALDTMRTETRVTTVCDVSAVAHSRAWSITGPLVLALKWTGLCCSNCPLTCSPGTTWEPGRQAGSRALPRAAYSNSALPKDPN